MQDKLFFDEIERHALALSAVKDALCAPFAALVAVCKKSLANGGKLFFFGNGGSAADAQHIAAELVNRYQIERPPIAAIALTTDTSILTSIANDTTFEEVFGRQIEALGQEGDIAIAITTSGHSVNIIRGVEAARQRGLRTIGLLGNDGGAVKNLIDLPIIVPSPSTSRIQEVHITIGHILCELVEQSLYPSSSSEEK